MKMLNTNKKLLFLRIFAFVIASFIITSLILRFIYWNYFTENFDINNTFAGVKSYNQFFYFTTISNVLVAVYLFMFAVNPKLKLVNITAVQIALACYILITMLVYFMGTFISEKWFVGYFVFDFTNVLLHIVSPISYITIFLLSNKKEKFSYTDATMLLFFPVSYAVVITLYSNIIGWFPYSFLNGIWLAKNFNISYNSAVVPAFIVVCTCISIFAVCLLVVFNIVFINNLQCKKKQRLNETQYQ